MTDSYEALEARLKALEPQGEASQEKVDLLLAMAKALQSNQPSRILELAEEALALSERLGYASGRAHAYYYKGFAHYLLSELETAYTLLKEGMALMHALDDQDGSARMLSALAGVQMSLGRYEQSLANGIEALKLFRQTGNRLDEAWALTGFGSHYTDFGAYERALEFYKDALAIFEDLDVPIGEARARNGIGTVYHSLGDYEEALRYHIESLNIFRKAGNRIGEARALSDLGIVSQHLGEDDKALTFHQKSLRIRKEVGNRQAQSTSLIHLGLLCLEQGKTEEALEALHEALAIAEDVKAGQRIYQAHQGLAEAYERMGNLPAALHHLKAFHRAREEVLGEETQSNIRTLQTRFEVEKAEQAAELQRLRNDELKAAQDQLIQQEKLASLGQLTAGIAHEIKNPLNFVNNFSQLSIELADEVAEALADRRDETVGAVLEDVQGLLDDLKFNAEKIHEHGRRADAIIRNMLEHSRSSPGERRKTDLNAIVEEYVNLAYHGMRARTTNFVVTLERDYAPDAGSVEIVPQDIGRVILNLTNNAFFAVHEKAAEAEDGYTPHVSVSTRRTEKAVEVRIEDNGPGIPEALREKIFEPFYTTKPTGEGTGLGLSISYDVIVQGHGGTLSVESEEGAGAMFVITLPAAPAAKKKQTP